METMTVAETNTGTENAIENGTEIVTEKEKETETEKGRGTGIERRRESVTVTDTEKETTGECVQNNTSRIKIST